MRWNAPFGMVINVLEMLAILVGTGLLLYVPSVGGRWLLRKRNIKKAWQAKPSQMLPKKRSQLARILFQEAVVSHQHNDHGEAARICQQVLKLEPDDTQASRLLVASLFACGDFHDASQALERHMSAHPGDEAAKLVPAAIFCERGDMNEARAALDAVDPGKLPAADQALWYNNYAYTLSGLGVDLDLAKDYGQRAFELAAVADRQFTLRTLGVVHLARKEPAIALDKLHLAMAEREYLRPGDVDFTRFHLSLALDDLGRHEDAVQEMKKVAGGTTLYAEKAKQKLSSWEKAAQEKQME